MVRYSPFVLLCVIALMSVGLFQGASVGDAYADDGVQPRDERSDCNGNGITDEFETSPLAGHALGFDGVDDYVIPDSPLALRRLGQGDFTLEAWVCTSDTRTNVLISNLKITSRYYHFVITNASEGGVLRFVFKDGEDSYTCTGATRVADGRWHHVAAVRSTAARVIAFYVDGQVDTIAFVGTTSFTANQPTLIGRDQYASPHFFAGAMDEVRMWSVERSQAQIVDNMHNTLNGNETGLVAYWRFDDGSGSVAHDSAGSHDGTLVGSPTWAQSLDDCNKNAIPDECEVGGMEDCNTNGIPDLCDIYNGTSEDCNGNGVPDECETLPSVIYVDDDATSGLNDGSSWANAHTDLQTALAHAKCSGRVDEIRVAGGTHKPGTSREDSFHLLNGVALRGGYRGLEGGGDPNERNTSTFTTTLSGDINGDDQWEWENRSDNSNHVVVGSNTDASAVLDGFTISGGYAEEAGGGLYCQSGRLKVINCTFMFNWAAEKGGAIEAHYGGPTLTGCVFSGNEAGDHGGGLSNTSSNPTLTDCLFFGNKAVIAGAISNYYSSPTLTNCVFIGNAAEGEVKGGGAIRNFYQSSPTLVGCIFSGNSGYRGGAIYNEWLCAPTITNCTFIGNAAVAVGGGLYCNSYEPASAVVVNSIFWGNSAAGAPQLAHGGDVLTIATYSCIQGGYEGVGNISVDPMFIDADGGDDVFGTFDDNWHVQAGSPCINAGDDSEVPASARYDYDGDDRIQQCRVDMGADETPFFVGEDCNNNGVSDMCDIEDCDGSAWCSDCNGNAVPDECEVGGTEDCNANSIPDLCDIYDGDSEDCNGNGVPDECETLPSGVIYVDDDATSGSNDGSSWANAHTDLQTALAHAKCSGLVDEIRVAGGTHKPGTSREDSLHLLNGVALRGGYRGLEGGGDPNERNTSTFTTTLSGDINGDDQWEWENRSDNSNHVVVGSNTDASAVLDGFTISGGYAEEAGGGLYCQSGRLKVINCTFMFNWAAEKGGAIEAHYGGPTLTGCVFSGNEAGDYGGGLDNTSCQPTLTDCLFVGNKAVIAGAICNYSSSPTLTNCVFIANAAEGEVKGGGAIRNFYQSSPTLVGCIFSGNSGYRGGAIYNEWLCAPMIINCTFTGNAAVAGGGGLYCHSYEPASAVVVNSIFWGNSAGGAPQIAHGGDVLTIATYSCIQGGYEGVGNISVDPMFIDADGGDDVFGTFDDNWHLLEASPCINAGDDSEVPAGVTHDFDGDDRIQHCRVDMGADETPYFEDCNNNGVSDECDIEDCDGSAWCSDCNTNGVLDECDIEAGTSLDVDPADGIPDDCNYLMMGACCLHGDCSVEWQADCLDAGGVYQGDGTTCDSVECPEELLGDMNGDGVLDANDIPLFTEALLNQGPDALLGDMNGDGVLNGNDIQPFADALLTQ